MRANMLEKGQRRSEEELLRTAKFYFGEYVGEERLLELVRSAKNRGLMETMGHVRRALIDEGHSVPFRAMYRIAGEDGKISVGFLGRIE